MDVLSDLHHMTILSDKTRHMKTMAQILLNNKGQLSYLVCVDQITHLIVGTALMDSLQGHISSILRRSISPTKPKNCFMNVGLRFAAALLPRLFRTNPRTRAPQVGFKLETNCCECTHIIPKCFA